MITLEGAPSKLRLGGGFSAEGASPRLERRHRAPACAPSTGTRSLPVPFRRSGSDENYSKPNPQAAPPTRASPDCGGWPTFAFFANVGSPCSQESYERLFEKKRGKNRGWSPRRRDHLNPSRQALLVARFASFLVFVLNLFARSHLQRFEGGADGIFAKFEYCGLLFALLVLVFDRQIMAPLLGEQHW